MRLSAVHDRSDRDETSTWRHVVNQSVMYSRTYVETRSHMSRAPNRSKTRPQTSTCDISTRIRTYATNLIWLDSHFDSGSIRYYTRTIGKHPVRILKTTSRRNLKFTANTRLNFLLAHNYFNQLKLIDQAPIGEVYVGQAFHFLGSRPLCCIPSNSQFVSVQINLL